MGSELQPISGVQAGTLCTLDLGSTEGRMKALAIIGGSSEAGKDWLPANKPIKLEICDVIIQRTEEYVKDDGETVAAGWKATCVLRNGDMVHFSSYRVVQYLRACLEMWGCEWKGLTLQITKQTANGKTSYKVEYLSEGCGRD